jgi:uncharacterized delta-60 repeat protein
MVRVHPSRFAIFFMLPLAVIDCVGDDSSIPDSGPVDATTDTSPQPEAGNDATSDVKAEAEAGPTCIVPDSGAPGSLDTTFNTALLTSITNSFGASSIAIDTTGNVYIGGVASGAGCNSNGGSSFAIVRLTSAGNVDTTFNAGNVPKCFAIDTTAGGINQPYAIAIDSMGRIVLGGISGHPGHYFASVIRVTNTGALDTSFDGTGTLDVLGNDAGTAAGSGNGFVTIYGVAIGAGDKVVISGSDDNGGSGNPWQAGYIARLTSGGSLDLGFATGGTYSDPTVHGYWGITVSATDDSITAVGYDKLSPTHMVLRHLVSAGTPDPTFGTPTAAADAGLSTVAPFTDGGFNDVGRSVIQLPNGEYLAAGPVSASNETGIVGAALVHSNGQVDTTFGHATVPTLTFYGFYVTNALGSLCNGNMYVMGDIGASPNEDVAVTKLLPNGQVDTTFGTNGITTIAIPGNQIPAQMAQDPITGKLLIVGTGGGTAVARINP